jgi:MoaA/NifB/PqqE/SkfB family radical SAM enzyme
VPHSVRSKLYNPKWIGKVQGYLRIRPRKQLRIEVALVDHCNLNCAYCAAFSPVADEKYRDPAVFERDMARLSELTGGRLESIRLLGGEPLLHPNITDFFDIARKHFKYDVIQVVTNGILLLKQDTAFWQNCKKNGVLIQVSRYPINLDFQAMEQTAKSFDVSFGYANSDLAVPLDWHLKTMGRYTLDIQGKQNIKKSFAKCYQANNCINLLDGKLATCPTVFYAKYVSKQFNINMQVTENDYIDIYKAKNIQEIKEFLCKPVPFCRYCNVKGRVGEGLKWEVSKKDISEWT